VIQAHLEAILGVKVDLVPAEQPSMASTRAGTSFALYSFGRARAYLLILDDKSYDYKAILGVAYRCVTGRHDFIGGVYGALSALGFRDRQYHERDLSNLRMQ